MKISYIILRFIKAKNNFIKVTFQVPLKIFTLNKSIGQIVYFILRSPLFFLSDAPYFCSDINEVRNDEK